MNFQETTRMTKGEAAAKLYPDAAVDCAVPQSWVDNMVQRGFDNPASHFVTCYFQANKSCTPTDVIMPVTAEGVRMAAVVTTYSA